MKDPHVTTLKYRIITSDDLVLDEPPRKEWSYDDYDVNAENGEVQIHLKAHYSNLEEARNALYPFIRQWEIDQGLFYGRECVWFEFVDGEVIDQDPPALGEEQTIQAAHLPSQTTIYTPTITQTLPYYPDPPESISMTPNTETLWSRFLGYRNRREPLPSMGYFCLTLVEGYAGDRRKAASKLHIEFNVLDKLGSLTANAGDETEARKFPKNQAQTQQYREPREALRPLTKRERQWIEDVVKALIRRSALLSADDNQPLEVKQLTMDDFVPLEHD